MKTFIIFEAGVNHNGDFRLAHRMIDEAVRNGADAIKFQKWGKEYYNKCEWRNVLDGLELSNDEFIDLKKYAKIKGIDFFITAFDNESFDFVKTLDMNAYKIPSNKYVVKDEKLIGRIIRSAKLEWKRLIISCDDIILFYDKYKHHYLDYSYIDFLYCNGRNSNNRLTYMHELNFTGISDHSSLIEIPIAAVALGAKVVEVHVTLDKNMNGPDHKVSLDINEFSTMVKMIRNVEKAL